VPSSLGLRAALLGVWLASGCNLIPDRLVEQGYDPDGDGVPWPEDCDSSNPARYPGAQELWYDGVDSDCGLDDDYDRDRDGWVPSAYAGLPTAGVEGSGALPGGDCWDDPERQDDAVTVIPDSLADAAGRPLAWVQPTAAEVHPGAVEVWYDGVDQDCDGQDDLDQDGDGWRTSSFPDRAGVFGDDCIDGAPLDAPNPAGLEPAGVNPGAVETFYDGTDQDCDGEDCDQDGDGQSADPEGLGFCETVDCDDTDSQVGAGDAFTEVWYDGVDQDCDGDDGDQDGDGYWAADYDARVLAAGGEPLTVPAGQDGDCWDVPAEVEAIPEDFTALDGYPQPLAAETFPSADDPVYDGIDQDCGGDDDFDRDGDGAASDSIPNRAGEVGADCDDGDPAINPWAPELWYDGRDLDCDGNDGDQDGDGYWIADYAALVAAWGGVPLPIPAGFEGDCDDGDALVYPNAEEWCDGVDSDCDGELDLGALDASTWCVDADGDGFGDATTAAESCTQPAGTVSDATDCDDTRAVVHLGAIEICDGLDDDCDGLVDQLDPSVADALTWYADADADGFGDAFDPGALWCLGDEPAGSVLSATDCDDAAAATNPAAVEVCDHADDDCDGMVDEPDAADAATWYADLDADGFGDGTAPVLACWQPTGFVGDGADCDDGAADTFPGAAEVVADGVDQNCDTVELCFTDADADGWGTGAVIAGTDLDCDDPGEAWVYGDCDDSAAAVFPGAGEGIADGVDQDCDGEELCFRDADRDTFGGSETATSPSLDCTAILFSAVDTDCDDGDAAVHPGAAEGTADGVDQDCDGLELCYLDLDEDGFGTSATALGAVDCSDSGQAALSADCDDADAAVFPGASEGVADGVDQDCDGYELCFVDLDEDGWGGGATTATGAMDCSERFTTTMAGDCDDSDAGTNPGVVEVCGGADEDCDGLVDDADSAVLGTSTWYADADSDGFGDPTGTVAACAAPVGYVVDATDCDDSDPLAFPGGEEHCDGLDTDCDGTADEDDALEAHAWYWDGDGDGWGDLSTPDTGCYPASGYTLTAGDCDDADPAVWPGAAEVCGDGVDDDCDGIAAACTPRGSLELASADARLLGPGAGDGAGWAVAGAGDVDGDGYGDLAVGAPGVGSGAGSVALVFGPVHGDLDLGSADLTLLGEGSGDGAGRAVAARSDEALLLVGADGADLAAPDAGAAYVVAISGLGTCSLTYSYARLLGEAASDAAGAALADLGDLTGDARSEMLVGAWGNDAAGAEAGAAYLVDGSTAGDFGLAGSTARLRGEVAGDRAGWAVAGAGDVDGDGVGDMLIGAPWNAAAGIAYLLLAPPAGEFALADADARLLGAPGDRAGSSLAGVGDVDGDGRDDFLVGAPDNGVVDVGAGCAYLVAGAPSGDVALASVSGARLLGAAATDAAGWSVAGGGDVNGDGTPDLLVGAPWATGSAAASGSAFLVFGPVSGDLSLAGADAVLRGEDPDGLGGWSLAVPGDVDADGWDDLLVGAPSADLLGTDAGGAYLVRGGGG
jgi:hypothetical protein